MKNLAEYFERHEIKIIEEHNADRPEVFRHWRVDLNAKEAFSLVDLLSKDKKLWTINEDRTGEILDNSKASWQGCTYQEFVDMGNGQMDMGPFNRARANLKEFAAKVQEELAPVGRIRKRRMSEHDGEWIPERQWEMQQFAATYKENGGILPTLQVDVDFSFSAMVDAAQIAKYGAFCWAIVDALEGAGITVGLALRVGVQLDLRGGSIPKKGSNTLFNFEIKKPGEYMDAMSMARCFTPGFFRRGCFSAFFGVGTVTGGRVGYGIGSPYIESRPVVEPGKVYLRRDDLKQGPEAMAERVLQALDGQKEGAA